jgi:hypothetical protein
MRKHGSIHLFIAGMIAVFLDFHAARALAAQAKPLVKVVAGYGSTDGAVAPLWFAKETKLFEKRQAEGSSKLQSRIMPLFLELARR